MDQPYTAATSPPDETDAQAVRYQAHRALLRVAQRLGMPLDFTQAFERYLPIGAPELHSFSGEESARKLNAGAEAPFYGQEAL